MGGGGAIRDHACKWSSRFSTNFGVGLLILVELLAINHGLKLAWNMWFKQIILECNCFEVVQIITDDVQVLFHQILEMVCDIRV
ncbi:hypothetical protein Lal_00009822 [Lupinus albus]|nr:hypothetical protein Lal_00009822 [Lupinus albus]